MTTLENSPTPSEVVVREGEYGKKIATVEPGGVGFIPLTERHGRPLNLLWTWTSPNLEFATVFLGVLAVAAFGLSFWQAVAAIVLGTGLGAVAHGVLSARGPGHGVAQMVLGRVPFGFRGNILPASLNTVAGGIGWFAVNSVSATLALNTLTGLPKPLCLTVVVGAQAAIAFFGHNLVHAFERYAFPVLAVVFGVVTVIILSKADFGAPGAADGGGVGGFLIAMAASFGYAAGWNPYAADYTRYLPVEADRRAVGLFAGLGVFLGCVVLQIVGAASVTIGGDALGDPTGTFTGHLPALIADLTLLAITLGAVGANAINIYSGSMSFVTLGIKLPLPSKVQRAMVALVFGAVGLVVAYFGLDDAGHDYETFLLIIAYWIGPWLGVVLVDLYLRRGKPIDHLLFDPLHRNRAGPTAMAAGVVLSVWLFSNQEKYVGPIPDRFGSVGDITFEAGFLISAGLYLVLRPLRRSG
ncbi:purine-cytosine permease family protein [Actinomadura sp. HBU206391]|uniref:purine-cytosine permease family protein n=1 Tax=Actinomadura sp. HBU206391 TaxID=2731692 RepID=UPI00164FBD27|nr:cytosine permease [Actinomadura sp. HBU206391]MBC6458383.1 cytosine permease [Actinomadura sp. HBU206391]